MYFLAGRGWAIDPQVVESKSEEKSGYAESVPTSVLIFFLLIVARTTLVVPKSDSSCGQDRMFGFQLTQRVAL
jgi:hypothetical protein